MCAYGNGFPQPPPLPPTPPLFGAAEALYCSQGLESESEKANFLRGAKKNIHLFLSVSPIAQEQHECKGNDLYAASVPFELLWYSSDQNNQWP